MTEPRPTWQRPDSMPSFASPNYTQVPNDLFETHMATMGEAELRVVLALVRQTLGFHRVQVRMSLTDLEEMTGLSRQGVLNGTDQAVEHGFILKESGNGVTTWVVNVVDQLKAQVVNVVDQTSQRSRPPSIKERIKKYADSNESDAQAAPAAKPVPKPKKAYEPEEPALRVHYSITHCKLNLAAQAKVIETVRDLDLWARVVDWWHAGHGYSPKNVNGMLDIYKTGFVPDYKKAQEKRDAESRRRGNNLSPDVYLPDGTIDPNGGWLS